MRSINQSSNAIKKLCCAFERWLKIKLNENFVQFMPIVKAILESFLGQQLL